MANSETSSTRFDAPLSLELTPSRRLAWGARATVVAALVSLGVSPLPIHLQFAGAALVVAGSLWQWRRLASRLPRGLRVGREWALCRADGWREVRYLRCTYQTALLIIVEVELQDEPGRQRWPILADQTDRESWRRLRRCLMRAAQNGGSQTS